MIIPASTVDLVIVGAGAAGLAATRTALANGLSVALVEAKKRTGGRAYTESDSFGVPFDHGCHWMHSASMNPFVELADRYGFSYRREPVLRQIHLGDRWASKAELAERQAFYDRNFAAIRSAAEAGRDIPVSEVMERSHRWSPAFDHWITAIDGVEPENYSTVDYAGYVDTGENWPVREGFGALIARYGAGLPVALNTPVQRVDWTRQRISVETPQGTLSARAALITVSTGVLASGAIHFNPALPDWKLAAIAAVPMGRVNKIAMGFSRSPIDMPGIGHVTRLAKTRANALFQLKPFGSNMIIGWVGGRICSELESAGPAAMADFGLERLKLIFGSSVTRHLTKTVCTAWESDPHIRGGYGAALPGQGHRRADLGKPIDDRLFFAGEATSPDFYTTAHGAYLSGIAAANSIAEALIGKRSVC